MPRTVFALLCLAVLTLPAGAVDQVRPNYVSPGNSGGNSGNSRGNTVVVPPSSSRTTRRDDCHRNIREHYLPEAGRVVRHRHVGPACRPVLVDPDDLEPAYSSDCHRDARRHWLPGSDGPVLHRHVGDRCDVRIIRRSNGG